jgi:hypothetical protein
VTTDLSDSILRFKEESTCCWRLWVGGLRPFRMGIYPYSKIAAEQAKARGAVEPSPWLDPDGVILERPFKFPIFCLCRPVLRVRHNSLGYLATIRNPFTLCHWHFDICVPDGEGEPGVPVVIPPGVRCAAAHGTPPALRAQVQS